MQLKGLAKVRQLVDEFEEAIDEKVDAIEWDGKNDRRDQAKDEMFMAALDHLLEAQDALDEIRKLTLEDFM